MRDIQRQKKKKLKKNKSKLTNNKSKRHEAVTEKSYKAKKENKQKTCLSPIQLFLKAKNAYIISLT